MHTHLVAGGGAVVVEAVGEAGEGDEAVVVRLIASEFISSLNILDLQFLTYILLCFRKWIQ
jgi:hypothetical protein